MSAAPEDAVRQQVAELYRRGGFRPLARYLPDEHREDRIAEAVALTFNMALRYAVRGLRLDDALLVHHAKPRVTDHSRHLVSSHGRGVDALNQRNFVAGKTEVLHVDGVVDAEGDADTVPEGDQQLIALAVRRSGDPAEHLASAFDLQAWLSALDERDLRFVGAPGGGAHPRRDRHRDPLERQRRLRALSTPRGQARRVRGCASAQTGLRPKGSLTRLDDGGEALKLRRMSKRRRPPRHRLEFSLSVSETELPAALREFARGMGAILADLVHDDVIDPTSESQQSDTGAGNDDEVTQRNRRTVRSPST